MYILNFEIDSHDIYNGVSQSNRNKLNFNSLLAIEYKSQYVYTDFAITPHIYLRPHIV